jgi:hypothetical protein
MKLNVKAFALAGGILWSASILILTWLEAIPSQKTFLIII